MGVSILNVTILMENKKLNKIKFKNHISRSTFDADHENDNEKHK